MKGILCSIVLLGGLMLSMMSTATLGVVAKKKAAPRAAKVKTARNVGLAIPAREPFGRPDGA